MGTLTAFAFLVGGITSMVSGYIGMMIAVFTNARCTMCATMVPEQTAWRESFNSAFRGGAVMGFALAGLGLLVMYFLMCLYVSAFEVWPMSSTALCPSLLQGGERRGSEERGMESGMQGEDRTGEEERRGDRRGNRRRLNDIL